MSDQVSVLGIVGRALSSVGRLVDGTNQYGGRRARYGERYTMPVVPDLNVLADEGSFYVANNAQTGIATAAAPTAFSATNPFVVIYNSDSSGGKRIYLDALTLVNTAAGTAGASLQVAVTVDSTNRWTSGGTALTPKNVNMDESSTSVAVIHAGDITAAAASGDVRTIVGDRFLKGAIPVAGDEYTMIFGGVDVPATFGISTIIKSGIRVPPVVIGPGHSALVHIWLVSQSGASSYAPELSWWER